MRTLLVFAFALTFALGVGQDAHAYIGPGAGLSALGAFWGLLVAVFAALSFLILWPVRRLFRKSGATPAAETESRTEAGDEKAAR